MRFWLVGVTVAMCLAATACGRGGDNSGAEPSPSDASAKFATAVTEALHKPEHWVEAEELPFVRGELSGSGLDLEKPTSIAFGPDGRLYVAEQSGRIQALTLEGNEITSVQLIAESGVLGGAVLGLAFNPTDPPAPVTLYASFSAIYEGPGGQPFSGGVARLSAPDYTPDRIISGLPVAPQEHATTGIAFDASGRLYIGSGSGTNAGVVGDANERADTPLSGAVLVADLTNPDFDGQMRYRPETAVTTTDIASGDVRVFAPGLRNPYDLVIASNGSIYATDNGSGANSGNASATCETDTGEAPWGQDELNRITEGAYYGQANRNRGRSDPRQCIYYGTFYGSNDLGGDVTPPIAALGYSPVVTGLAEYTSDALGGRLLGNLLYVEWSQRRLWRVQLSDDGTAVMGISQLVEDRFQFPTDVTVGPDGNIYVAEWESGTIAFLVPDAS